MSAVYRFFEIKNTPSNKARCTICKKLYAYNNSTKGLWDHLEQHAKEYKTIAHLRKRKNQSTNSSDETQPVIFKMN